MSELIRLLRLCQWAARHEDAIDKAEAAIVEGHIDSLEPVMNALADLWQYGQDSLTDEQNEVIENFIASGKR